MNMNDENWIRLGNRKIQSSTWTEFRHAVSLKYKGRIYGKMDYEIDRALKTHAERIKKEMGMEKGSKKETSIFS